MSPRIRELQSENEELRRRLEEAEETLAAIRSGAVDGFVVDESGSEAVYTLESADRPYRKLVEAMQQGAVTMTADGTVLFCNPSFSRMVGIVNRQLPGMSIYDLIYGDDLPVLQMLLDPLRAHNGRGELRLRRPDGSSLPVHVTMTVLPNDGPASLCAIVTDLTEQKQHEEVLAAEERAHAIVEHALDAIIVCDTKGTIIRTNPAAAALCGENPLMQPFASAFPLRPVEADEVLDLDRVVAGRVVRSAEVCLAHGDGWRATLLMNAGPLGRAGLPAVGCVIVLTDITARKQAEEALVESTERFRGVFEKSAIGMSVVGLDGRWLKVNRKLCEIVGYSRDELLTRTFQDITHPDDLEGDLELMGRVLRADLGTFSLEKRYIRKDRSTMWGRVTVSLVRDHAGLPRYFVAVVEDIDARKQMEEALRDSEQRLRVALSAAGAVAFVWDVADDIVVRYFSTEPALPVNPVPEHVADVVKQIHPDDRKSFGEALDACLASGTEYRNVYRVVRADGVTRWLEEWGTLTRDEVGLPKRLTGIAVDVTERKENEEALRRSEERYRRLLEESGRSTTC